MLFSTVVTLGGMLCSLFILAGWGWADIFWNIQSGSMPFEEIWSVSEQEGSPESAGIPALYRKTGYRKNVSSTLPREQNYCYQPARSEGGREGGEQQEREVRHFLGHLKIHKKFAPPLKCPLPHLFLHSPLKNISLSLLDIVNIRESPLKIILKLKKIYHL